MRVQLLDCTLRDGGLGLEDLSKTSPSERGMTESSIKYISEKLSESNVDIIELGSIEISNVDKKNFGIYGSSSPSSITMIPTALPTKAERSGS